VDNPGRLALKLIAPTRRRLILGGLATVGGLSLAGCDRLARAPAFRTFLDSAEGLTQAAQRLLQGQALAREFRPSDISPRFRANGTVQPASADYQLLDELGFETWTLRVDGLVRRPLDLSLAQLRALEARSQITRHDCVEGWSAIGQWTGPQLSNVLNLAGLMPGARYIVFRCADAMSGEPDGTDYYYESIDLIDAFHPQTILAYAMNGRPLDTAHGAPLRLRVERQLGYKHAKYVMRIEAVDSLAGIGRGRGGYWEDGGYEWYAGA
jgi:DMSO/TMAO reductase YedYZ molybdopterin-dependent catalytic subunit